MYRRFYNPRMYDNGASEASFVSQDQPMTPYERFAKPAQPLKWPTNQAEQTHQSSNPLLALFQDSQGNIDIYKMLSTADQLTRTFQRISPVVKAINSFMKDGYRYKNKE